MALPERFSKLPDYAFPRLRKLLDAHAPGGEVIAMTIGEPRHPMPPFVGEALAAALDGFSVYPPNEGAPVLLNAIAAWIRRMTSSGSVEVRIASRACGNPASSRYQPRCLRAQRRPSSRP